MAVACDFHWLLESEAAIIILVTCAVVEVVVDADIEIVGSTVGESVEREDVKTVDDVNFEVVGGVFNTEGVVAVCVTDKEVGGANIVPGFEERKA